MMVSAVVDRLRAAGCVFAEDEAALLVDAAQDSAELAELVERRVSGLPLEHVLGWAEFRGLRIAVDPGVFVPRRRTEYLVEQAATLIRPGGVIVDLCCGSGAVGAALLDAVGDVELHAADIDPIAVRCARRNVANVYEGDLYAPLPLALRGKVDVLVANAPYVPTDAVALMPPEARDYEPRVALDGGADGLDIIRRVAADARTWLTPTGHLLFEAADRQVPAAIELVTRHGLAPRVVHSEDLAATVVIGAVRSGN
jgi:release factor glutamine methyltransferase